MAVQAGDDEDEQAHTHASRPGAQRFRQGGLQWPLSAPGPAQRYYFRLYALSETLSLPPNATKAELLAAMEGKIVAQTELMGRFAR